MIRIDEYTLQLPEDVSLPFIYYFMLILLQKMSRSLTEMEITLQLMGDVSDVELEDENEEEDCVLGNPGQGEPDSGEEWVEVLVEERLAAHIGLPVEITVCKISMLVL